MSASLAIISQHAQVSRASEKSQAALVVRWQRALEGLTKWDLDQLAADTWWINTRPGTEFSAHQYIITDRDGLLHCSCPDFSTNGLHVCKHVLAVLAQAGSTQSNHHNIKSEEVSEMFEKQVLDDLALPFGAAAIEWKCGARNREKTRGIALAYVDSRDYITRLNEVFGLGWEDTYTFTVAGNRLLCVCMLKVHLSDGQTITRTGDGECDLSDDNATTVASAQAFKRSCVKFGLGAFLYSIPQQWVALENERYIPHRTQEGLRLAYESWRQTGQWRFGEERSTPAAPSTRQPNQDPPSAPVPPPQQPTAGAQGPGAMVVKFGKYVNQTVSAIYEQEPSYIAWLAENAKFQPLRAAAGAYLNQMAQVAA